MTVSCFLNRNLAGQKRVTRNIQSDEKQGTTAKIIYLAKLLFRRQRHIKSLSDKKNLEEFIATKRVLHEMLKALL